ncbi:hypothetical protein JTE90_023319 [Oedothorax gibbosus]|uniref:Uncharacterized protein n=1 Tax=Oedothorax gibbosus TaxID=931172 RepID=A0AAV6VF85_9ARAC|nr:hypothetical protein JTE90_023319 [Oedothorax gibbosus]
MKSSYFQNSISSLQDQMSSIHGIRSYLSSYKRTLAASPIYVGKVLTSEQSSIKNDFYEGSSYKLKTEAVDKRILVNFERILSSTQPKGLNLPECDDKATLGSNNTEGAMENCSSDGSLCSQCKAPNPNAGVSKENGNDGTRKPLSSLELINNYKAKTEAVGRRIIENFELILSSIGKSGQNSPGYDSKVTVPSLNNASSEISSCSLCRASNPKYDVLFENDVYEIKKASPSFESASSENTDKVESPRIDSNYQRVLSWLQDLNPAEYDDVAVWNGGTHSLWALSSEHSCHLYASLNMTSLRMTLWNQRLPQALKVPAVKILTNLKAKCHPFQRFKLATDEPAGMICSCMDGK